MEHDEIRILEHKSRSLEQELRVRRIELGQIETETRSARERMAASNVLFRDVKQRLLQTSAPQPEQSHAEKMAAAKTWAQKLSKLGTALAEQEREVETLLGKGQTVRRAATRIERQVEKLGEHIGKLQKHGAAAAELAESEEMEELSISHRAGRQKDSLEERGASGRDGSVSKDNHCARSFSRENPAEHTPRDAAAPQYSAQPEQQSRPLAANSNNAQSIQSARARTFREALTDTMQQRVEALKKWEQLDQSGIGFDLQTSTGKKIGIQIASHTTAGVTVRIEPEHERDRHRLWRERAKIAAALAEHECRVKSVAIQGRAKPCR